MMLSNQIGIIGLGTMGLQLALNFKDHAITVEGYDTSSTGRKEFKQQYGCDAHSSIESLFDSLPPPRIILLLIPDQALTEHFLLQLLSMMECHDILINAGNSHYRKTEQFQQIARDHGKQMVGMGISGGTEGARHGAAIMLGGNQNTIEKIVPVLSLVAAPLNSHQRCLTLVGPDGAGHFAKMVHNGIEYAEMQIIVELWLYLHHFCGLPAALVAKEFSKWQQKDHSYLLHSAAEVLSAEDTESNTPLIQQIIDQSCENGTGRWSVIASLEYGAPIPSIAEAVFTRHLSQLDRNAVYGFRESDKHKDAIVALAYPAFVGARISAYAQGFSLLEQASHKEKWGIDLESIANGWRNGCIIRGTLIDDIAKTYQTTTDIRHLFALEHFSNKLSMTLPSWKQFIQQAMDHNLPIPVISSALNYYHSWSSPHLGANLIQGMRDYFGSHGLQKRNGKLTHHHWKYNE